MDKLKFILATRKTLIENGYFPVKRCFSFRRRAKTETFHELVNAHPSLFGKIGSNAWIRGLLTQLNEPTVLAWDDIEEWLDNQGFMDFLTALQAAASAKSSLMTNPPTLKEVKVKQECSSHNQPDETPRLKHATVKLVRCGKMVDQPKKKNEKDGSRVRDDISEETPATETVYVVDWGCDGCSKSSKSYTELMKSVARLYCHVCQASLGKFN